MRAISILTGKPASRPAQRPAKAPAQPSELEQMREKLAQAERQNQALRAEAAAARRARDTAIRVQAARSSQARLDALQESINDLGKQLEQAMNATPAEPPQQTPPDLSGIQEALAATARSIEALGTRLQSAIDAQTAELLAEPLPAPELEFDVRRDAAGKFLKLTVARSDT